MNSTSRLLFRIASILQIITGLIHSLSLFTSPEPADETQKQMVDLMNTYHMELGAGFRPTFADLFFALSSCFTLVCLFGGILNLYLLKKAAAPDLLKGVLNINL